MTIAVLYLFFVLGPHQRNKRRQWELERKILWVVHNSTLPVTRFNIEPALDFEYEPTELHAALSRLKAQGYLSEDDAFQRGGFSQETRLLVTPLGQREVLFSRRPA